MPTDNGTNEQGERPMEPGVRTDLGATRAGTGHAQGMHDGAEDEARVIDRGEGNEDVDAAFAGGLGHAGELQGVEDLAHHAGGFDRLFRTAVARVVHEVQHHQRKQ